MNLESYLEALRCPQICSWLVFALAIGLYLLLGRKQRAAPSRHFDSFNSENQEGEKTVWRMDKPGDLSSLQPVHRVSIDKPKRGEVVVKTKAIGLNFADIFSCFSLYEAAPTSMLVPGLEFSGVVQAVGEGVDDLEEGDAVFGFTRFGGYASHVTVDHRQIRPIPEGWTFEEAASFIVQALTAWHGIHVLGNLQPHQSILVQSGAGGVGLLAIEIALKREASVFATVGSAWKVRAIEEKTGLPADRVIVRKKASFKQQLEQALKSHARLDEKEEEEEEGVSSNPTMKPIPSDEGFDVVMESLGGSYFTACYDLLNRNGRLITFGATRYMTSTDKPSLFHLARNFLTRPTIDPEKMISDNKAVMGFNLIWLTDKLDALNEEVDELMALGWESNPPHVGKTFPFCELDQAVRFLQSGQNVGKVVVIV